MKPPLVAALAVALMLAFTPAAEAGGPDWDKIPSQKRKAGLDRANAHGLFAALDLNARGDATGRFVTFHYAAPIGVVHDFTVKHDDKSYEFFDAVTPNPFAGTKAALTAGAVFRVPNENVTLSIHNNPAAVSSWKSRVDGTNVTFTLAPGVTTAAPAAKQVRISHPSGGHGHIMTNGDGALTIQGANVTVPLDAGESALFVAHPPKGPKSSVLHALNGLFLAKRLGAVVNIADGQGAAIVDGLDVDVNVTVTRIARGALTIQAESNVTGPRILVFTVDADTLDCDKREKIHVKLNGSKMANTTAPEDVDAGPEAKVHVFCADRLAMILVKVPHFSTQTLEVGQEGAQQTGTPTPRAGSPGVGVAVALAALAGLAVLRRRAA